MMSHETKRLHFLVGHLSDIIWVLRNTLPSPGVTFQLVPHGLDNTTFEKGLANWRKRNPEISLEETTSSA